MQPQLTELLAQAAKLAAEHDLRPDDFMTAAWSACLEARPALREQLELAHAVAQLDAMRERGLVGQA